MRATVHSWSALRPSNPLPRALAKTYGQMWLRCDVCRRFGRLSLAGLHDVDYRGKTFSCSVCGAEAYLCLVNPTTEYGMADYRLDEREAPERHPEAVKRITARVQPARPSRPHGKLPARNLKGRR